MKPVFSKEINIYGKIISESSPVFIIAEAGVNHNGNIAVARQLIDIAVEAGADAVKFQTFKTENLIIPGVKKPPYQIKTTGKKETQYEMLKKLEISQEQNMKLLDCCKKNNIIFLTTPFDEESLDSLDILDLPAIKIASTDTTNLPFLIKIARKKRPLFLSTGMSYLSEIDIALQEIHPYNKEVILLQCTANYPIQDFEVNLNVIETFKHNFDILVGYSDHSVGIGAAPYSVAMGAKVVEKHFTVDKECKGPDHQASLSPNELKDFVRQIRKVEEYLGEYQKRPLFSEIKTRRALQKCMVAATDIKKGEVFSDRNIIAKRTGGEGISPIYYKELIGKKAGKDYIKNEIVNA